MYPFEWRTGPVEGYAFPWPGYADPMGAGAGCARLEITVAGGLVHQLTVAPRVLGLARLDDLDLVIDERLSRGVPVTLYGVDGRVLRLDPGVELEDIRVLPCG